MTFDGGVTYARAAIAANAHEVGYGSAAPQPIGLVLVWIA